MRGIALILNGDQGGVDERPVLLSDRQMTLIEPFFPLAYGLPRVDDRRVLSGIVFVIRNGRAGATRRQPMIRKDIV